MRKTVAIFLTVLTIAFTLPGSCRVYAGETASPVSIEYFEDGTYTETYIEEINSMARSQTKSGKKTTVKKTADGTKLWSVTVTASFTYDGKTAKCTKASAGTAVFSSSWKKYSSSASKSGATGTASAVFKRYVGASVAESVTGKVSLTCSASGTLS